MKHPIALGLIAILATALVSAAAPADAERELIQLEKDWLDAAVRKDIPFLDRLYTDDYITTEPDGTVMNKAEDLANMKAGGFQLVSYKLEGMKVRLYGGGEVAVVTGGTYLELKVQGKDASGHFRYTDVFVKQDGRWRCSAAHATLIDPDAP